MTVIAIFGVFASQAIAKDTAHFIQPECNNMGVMESECDSFSSIDLKAAKNTKPENVSAESENNHSANITSKALSNNQTNVSDLKVK